MSTKKHVSKFEKKTLKNGNPNPKYVDLLVEDKPLAGQKWGCVSFVSPENIIKRKELFFFEEFIKKWDFNKSLEKFHHFINFVSYKYNLNFDYLMKDLEEFVTEERDIIHSSLEGDYKTFLEQNDERLENLFNAKHEFQTSLRGLKLGGNYPSQEEAELRAKMLRENDPSHNVYVGPVGLWMPWDPEPHKTERVEYMEEELNQLMAEKAKNEKVAKSAFDERVKESKKKAIEENVKNAQLTGSSLTQTIDKDGNLVNVTSQETNLKSSGGDKQITSDDVHKELFEGENIVMTTKKNSSGPKKGSKKLKN